MMVDFTLGVGSKRMNRSLRRLIKIQRTLNLAKKREWPFNIPDHIGIKGCLKETKNMGKGFWYLIRGMSMMETGKMGKNMGWALSIIKPKKHTIMDFGKMIKNKVKDLFCIQRNTIIRVVLKRLRKMEKGSSITKMGIFMLATSWTIYLKVQVNTIGFLAQLIMDSLGEEQGMGSVYGRLPHRAKTNRAWK